MKVKFWGTRGSIAVPGKDTTIYGGNTTCLEITLQSGKKVIIDAGTGIRPLGDILMKEHGEVNIHLLITHIHWDHILGFPFFAPIYQPSTRILLDGFPSCVKGLRYTFDNKMGDGFFPVKFDDLKAKIVFLEKLSYGKLEIDGVLIEKVTLHHPQGGFGFRFQERDKTLCFITDNELRPDAPSGKKPKDFVKFCKDADILIHDSQYTPEEIELRKGWGHSHYRATFDLAHRADVHKLILFHHDPSRTDPEVKAMKMICEDMALKKSSDLVIEAARENNEFEL
jgi:phosphoribosyl 1,2-cyclic phosphodiesterase